MNDQSDASSCQWTHYCEKNKIKICILVVSHKPAHQSQNTTTKMSFFTFKLTTVRAEKIHICFINNILSVQDQSHMLLINYYCNSGTTRHTLHDTDVRATSKNKKQNCHGWEPRTHTHLPILLHTHKHHTRINYAYTHNEHTQLQ